MKFERNKIYTHKNMLDMLVFVIYDYMPFESYTKLRIKWFNRRGLDVNQEETIKITNEEAINWYEWKGKAV